MFLAMVQVLFILRKTRSNTGRHILYCRITLDGIPREISTGEEIRSPELWNQDRQIYEKPDAEGELVNIVCERLRVKIKQIYLSLEPEGDVTPDKIIKALKQPKTKRITLAEVVQDYIDYISTRKLRKKGEVRKKTTVRHYEIYLKNLNGFSARKVYTGEVTLEWAEEFKRYLMTKKHRPCNHKTRASRHIEFFKKALDHAVNKARTIRSHELGGYEFDRDAEKAVVFLTKEERQRFINARFDIPLLEKCRAVFVYHFRTGVSYGDLWATYEVKEFSSGGRILKVIIGTRSKNGRQFFLPWDPEADSLLNTYGGKLPYIDNSTYNKTLKILALLLNIPKHLVTNTARKSFIMGMDADGWTRETTQGMVAHESVNTTETYYMAPNLERLLNEMARRPV